jgi:uncharacterized Fe-S cluster protein YjdI
MEAVKEYTNGDVTVVWKPRSCIHSEKCWRGLPSVFNPDKKPWIDVEGANSQRIIDQVNQCPSGALSHYKNAEGPKITKDMSKIKIQVMENGPLRVMGEMEITHKDGSTEIKETAASFCRCGHSANKPFCDGSHKKEGFEG